MESLHLLKSRQKSVQNISQITKAMEVVSATKMRKSQETALRTRPYANKALELLARIASDEHIKIPFTDSRPVTRSLVVIISSDKGLAGSFNSQVFRAVDKFFEKDSFANNSAPSTDSINSFDSAQDKSPQASSGQDHSFLLVVIGKKTLKYAQKKSFEVVNQFQGFGDFVNPEEVEPLTTFVLEGFKENKWDRVVVISTHFRTTLKQDVLVRQVLPINVSKIKETVNELTPEYGRYAELKGKYISKTKVAQEYIFEPSQEKVIDRLVPHLLKMQLYQLVLEANASEHSARMVAMKNASSNAYDLGNEITLLYNKARQANITKELIEIVSTQNALTLN